MLPSYEQIVINRRGRHALRAFWWQGLFVAGVLLVALYFLLAPWISQTTYYTLVGCSAVGSILLGIRLHRPASARPWYLIAWGILFSVAGDAVWNVYELVGQTEPPFPSVADLLYLGSYPFLMLGIWQLFPRRAANDQSGPLIDAAIVTLSVTAVMWTFLIEPYAHDPLLSSVQRIVSIAYPLMDVLLVALVAQLLLAPRERSFSFTLIALSISFTLVADIVYGVQVLAGTYIEGSLVDAGWLFGYVFWGVAALHPAMANVPHASGTSASTISFGRVLFVMVAFLGGPIVLGIHALRGGQVDLWLVGGSSALLFILALFRMNLIVQLVRSTLKHQQQMLQAVQSSEERYALVTQATNDVIWDWDIEQDQLVWSDSGKSVLGYAPETVHSTQWWRGLIHPDDQERVTVEFESALARGETIWTAEYRFRRADGTYATVLDRGYLVKDNQGSPVRMIGSMMDITEREQMKAQLAFQAFHDPLTGLANRVLLIERLGHALTRIPRSDDYVAVLMFDLDRFKLINDSLGHAAGDQLLIAVSERILTCIREVDTLARLGGDEFCLLMEGLMEPNTAIVVAERIVEAMQAPFLIGRQTVFMTTSIGIAMATEKMQAEELIRRADLTMYRAKRNGKATYEVYDPTTELVDLERLTLEADLRRALEQEEFKVVYQPIVQFATGRITGVEALLRWEHPQQGLVLPMAFIPVAEETGLIVPIGNWILNEACRQAKRWQDDLQGQPPLTMSVNLSARQLQHPSLITDIQQALEKSGLAPEHLVLELTESMLVEHLESTSATLKGIQEMGVRIAIDDFGIGYSSLSYLTEFPIDELKIDKVFVDRLQRQSKDTAIIRMVIMLARTLGLDVVAEGVESADQMSDLQSFQCELGQGYYFTRPVPPEELTSILEQARQPSLALAASPQ